MIPAAQRAERDAVGRASLVDDVARVRKTGPEPTPWQIHELTPGGRWSYVADAVCWHRAMKIARAVAAQHRPVEYRIK